MGAELKNGQRTGRSVPRALAHLAVLGTIAACGDDATGTADAGPAMTTDSSMMMMPSDSSAPRADGGGMPVPDSGSMTGNDGSTATLSEAMACGAGVAVNAMPGMPVLQMATLTSDVTAFRPMCWSGATTGAAVFNVTVPAGMHDLIVSTDVAPTPDIDTVVEVRRTCTDAMTQVACNDFPVGASMERGRAAIAVYENAAAGTYAAIALGFQLSMSTPIGVEVRLRPVLAAGMACDPMGAMNRCAAMPCPTMGMAVCP